VARGVYRHVFEFVSHNVEAAREAFQRVCVVEVRGHEFRDVAGDGFRRQVERAKAQAERVARKRQHAPQLPAAEDADLHHASLGSGRLSTASVCRSRYALSAARNCGCLLPSIAAASSAALMAPARPMASVPTGMPAGICTMDKRESMPFKAFDSTGTPSTGSAVLAA